MRVQVQWLKQGSSGLAGSGSAYLADGESVTVGRDTGVDIQLSDEKVSRLHAEVYIDDSTVVIKDVGSTNGTLLDGRQVIQSRWEPGQSVSIGPYKLNLIPVAGPLQGSPVGVHARARRRAEEMRPAPPVKPGRIELGDVYQRAKKNDRSAVRDLFLGFLGRTENVVDAGYLGGLGLIFPEHSFWCVTNSRVCGMVVNAAGRLDFTFCFLKGVDVAHFHQPSSAGLWITLIGYLLGVAAVAVGCVGIGLEFGTLGRYVSFFVGTLLLAGGIALTPFVTRFDYRFTKSGCTFFTKELVYIRILADRKNLKAAQSLLRLVEEQKRALGA